MSIRNVVLLCTALIVAACGTPSKPVSTTQAPTTTPSAIEAGQTLYEANCATCHGIDLRGTSVGPSFLSRVYEPDHHGDGAFVVAVTRGVSEHHWNFGAMPPVEGLSLDEIETITGYVRSVQETLGFED